MPTKNMPDPAKIPDMSLGERTERPAQPVAPMPDASSIQEPGVTPTVPAPIPARRDEPATSPTWSEGDDVLAPWEPNILYPGTIRRIMADDVRGDQALIVFDDGGEGWVFVYSLCPLEIKVGQQVGVRTPNNQAYAPAKIIDVGDVEMRVRYDNGATDWVRLSSLRVPCIENGPGARATKYAPWQTPQLEAAAAAGGGGIPSWVIWIGIAILLAFVRVGCRAALQN